MWGSAGWWARWLWWWAGWTGSSAYFTILPPLWGRARLKKLHNHSSYSPSCWLKNRGGHCLSLLTRPWAEQSPQGTANMEGTLRLSLFPTLASWFPHCLWFPLRAMFRVYVQCNEQNQLFNAKEKLWHFQLQERREKHITSVKYSLRGWHLRFSVRQIISRTFHQISTPHSSFPTTHYIMSQYIWTMTVFSIRKQLFFRIL